MSLIASSIMSKKLASGADGIVLDVKTGDGAFMKTLEDPKLWHVKWCRSVRWQGGICRQSFLDMDQPLGYAVGNALEVKRRLPR